MLYNWVHFNNKGTTMEKLYDKEGNWYEKKQVGKRYPIRGTRGFYLKPACERAVNEFGIEWMVSLIDITIQLTNKQLQTYLRLVLLSDEYGIVFDYQLKNHSTIGISDRHQWSRVKAALIAAHAMIKTNTGYMLNPFVSPPKEGYYAQQIWRKHNFDNDAYFEGINETMSSLGL